MGAPEAYIEHYLKEQCKRAGLFCWKMTCASTAGVPDRMIGGNGKLCFIEVKRPGGKPRKLQTARINQLKDAGAYAGSLDTREAVDELIQWMTSSKKTPPYWLI